MRTFFFLFLPWLAVSWAEEPLNVVFILSDNQSYYEMSCHGHAHIKTPNIDRLASQSVDFRNFHAPPYCSPSRAVILTGRYAMRSGVHDTIGGRSILHADETTLADVLKKHGYRTGIFGKWHLGFSYPYRPQDRGFEEVLVHGGGGVGQMEDYFGNTLFDTTFLHNGEVLQTEGYCTDTLFDHAMAFVEQHREEPFFCFVPTPVTHSPHHGPKELVAELRAQGVEGNLELFAQVQNLDANIGRMMQKLEALGLSGKTLLIYASDQGMSDRGAPHGTRRLGVAYDPAHHVPFMVRAPGVAPGVCQRLAGMIDVFPTVLDFCGIDLPSNLDGMSVRPLLSGEPGYPEERTLVIQCPRGRRAEKGKNAAVKTDRWRWVEGNALFDAQADPRQTTNVADRHPKVMERLGAVYEAFWRDLPDQEGTLSRHLLGAPECPEVTLNGMDWHTGARPWHSGAFKGKGGNGAWAVRVARAGRYRIECRFFPREADRSAGATAARIQIGEISRTMAVDPEAKLASFELELPAGDHDLQTWFTRDGQELGALFVYVKAL